MVPDGVIQGESDKPAKKDIVVEVLERIWRKSALSSLSGGMEGLPVVEYMFASCASKSFSASSTIFFRGRRGWFLGTLLSGEK